jgi:hypothetical protein
MSMGQHTRSNSPRGKNSPDYKVWIVGPCCMDNVCCLPLHVAWTHHTHTLKVHVTLSIKATTKLCRVYDGLYTPAVLWQELIRSGIWQIRFSRIPSAVHSSCLVHIELSTCAGVVIHGHRLLF